MSEQFKFYKTAEETWEAMLAALKEARQSIEIEHYIFGSDKLGDKFIEVLTQKKAEGVRVRMLIDAVGSYGFYNSDVPDKMRQAGIEIKFFNAISPWRIHTFTSWFFRDHNKIIIIDSKVAFTGGLGIRENMAGWRDTNSRLEGVVVAEMLSSFLDMWGRERNIFLRITKRRAQKLRAHFITNTPYYKRRYLYYTVMEALRQAKKSILLTTPYFIPDRRLKRILRLAARRGVEVKIIVPKKSDVLLLSTAAHSSFSELLRSGVKIYKYAPAFLHAKTIVVDEEWVSWGSFNLDSLSFVYNFEGNVVSTERENIVEIKKHFEEDLAGCEEVKYEEWVKRPLIDKVREFFIVPVRGFL